jgi:predicted nuclease of predicted toxin-antitoxin system
VRFYLDEDLPYESAAIARSRGLDVTSSHECGRNGLRDEEQLALSAGENRCFVTRNYRDFVPLTMRLLEAQRPHAGVLLVSRSLPNEDFGGIANALLAYARRHETGLPSYTVDFLVPLADT